MANQPVKFFKNGRNFILLAAAAGMLSMAAPARAADDAFSPAQKEALGVFIKDYLVKNPDVVVEALTEYQKKQQGDEQALFSKNFAEKKDAIFNSNAPFVGPADADVTVVEFFDYNCGYCKKAVDDVVKLLESDKKLKVIFMDMPILSPTSQDAARWALAAGKQGKYYDFHVALMKDPGPKNEDGFVAVAKKIGLDTDKMKKDADSKEIRETIEKNLSIARGLGIHGTPGFIIGDILTPGYVGYESMKAGVDLIRSGKK